MTEIYTLYSESGDEYKLQFTTDRSGIIADDILDQLNAQGIELLLRFHSSCAKPEEEHDGSGIPQPDVFGHV